MPSEIIWLYDEKGEPYPVNLDDLDPDLLPQLYRPVGAFTYRAGDFVSLPLAEVPFYLKDWLPKQGRLEILSDSELIIKQLNGEYAIRDATLEVACNEIWHLCRGYSVKFTWVPREENLAGKILG